MKTKISLSRRTLLIFGLPIAGLMLGLLGNFALVAPQKTKAGTLDSQIVLAQAQLVTAQQHPVKAAPKPVPTPKTQSVQAADIFRLTKAMPDTTDMPGLLLTLSKIASASNVKLTSVTPAAVVPLAGGYGALPLIVVLSGKFAQVSGFLQLLRQQATLSKTGRLNAEGRLFVANEIQMTSSDGLTVAATLNLDAFIYGAGTPAVAPTTTTTTG
jgi:Pilus assembly protein, PilO